LSDSVIRYAAVQAKILRRYMPNAFITHNGFFKNIDYKKLTEECLDFLSFDSYPSGTERDGVGKGRRVEYRLAQTRGCSDRYLILEQQSGPGGQLSYLCPTPLPGQIRLWTYQSIAHGAVGVLYFRYRTALFGAEQLWYGIYDHDGEENYRSREVRQIAEEIRRCGALFLRERRTAEVAIFSSYHNDCCRKAEPFFADDSRGIFDALNQKNVPTDIIYTLEDLDRYRVVILPHVAIADEAMEETLRAFAEKGGIVILSAKSGTKDRNAHYRPMKNPGVFRDLAGCSVEWFTTLPEYAEQFVEIEGKRYPVERYYESLELEQGKVIGRYTEGFCQGKSAVVKNGNVYYLGFFCEDSAEIYYDIVRTHLDLAVPLDENLEEVTLGKYKMYLNHGDRAVQIMGYDLLQKCSFDEIPPYGVMLIET